MVEKPGKRKAPGTPGAYGRVLPATSELVAMRDQGMTLQQIADEVTRRTGIKVGRSAISADLTRNAPPTAKKQARYKDELPWVVKAAHINEYPARLLRLLGRRRAGRPLTPDENKRLDRWLAMLEEEGNLVVGYCPELEEGAFLYVVADETTDRPNGLPIRPRVISQDEIP